MSPDYLPSIEDSVVADEIHKYPSIWDSSAKDFKKKKTMKATAWRDIAKTFKTTTALAELRNRSLRTKVSRYLQNYKPSGSGTDDFDVRPDLVPLKWLFPLIKQRDTTSNSRRPTRPLTACSSTSSSTTNLESLDQHDLEGASSSDLNAIEQVTTYTCFYYVFIIIIIPNP